MNTQWSELPVAVFYGLSSSNKYILTRTLPSSFVAPYLLSPPPPPPKKWESLEKVEETN